MGGQRGQADWQYLMSYRDDDNDDDGFEDHVAAGFAIDPRAVVKEVRDARPTVIVSAAHQQPRNEARR